MTHMFHVVGALVLLARHGWQELLAWGTHRVPTLFICLTQRLSTQYLMGNRKSLLRKTDYCLEGEAGEKSLLKSGVLWCRVLCQGEIQRCEARLWTGSVCWDRSHLISLEEQPLSRADKLSLCRAGPAEPALTPEQASVLPRHRVGLGQGKARPLWIFLEAEECYSPGLRTRPVPCHTRGTI